MEKVLIIDDNPVDVRILKDILKDRYEVISSLESEDGVNKAKLNKPAVIVLDSAMPKAGGNEIILVIKNTAGLQDIPVIFTSVTAQVDPDTEEKWLSSGAVDYFIKPFSPGLVRNRVGTYVGLHVLRNAVERLELIDGLTLLPNRRSYDEKIKAEWGRSIREKTPISIAFIDIDNFTSYNSHYGSSNGDDVIRLIASEISHAISRSTDFAARYSPEKIVILLPNTSKKGAQIVYERVKKAVHNLKIPHAYSNAADFVTVSIGGFTAEPSYGDDMYAFAESADKMLYEAKSYGRNMIVFNEE